jgi:non-canonical (house-cleaning) NTP pyrophosphatase
VTQETSTQTTENGAAGRARRAFPLGRTLLWVGIGLGLAGASAAVGVVVVRMALRHDVPATDETAERIQALIDEANRLIKTLDEKKQS